MKNQPAASSGSSGYPPITSGTSVLFVIASSAISQSQDKGLVGWSNGGPPVSGFPASKGEVPPGTEYESLQRISGVALLLDQPEPYSRVSRASGVLERAGRTVREAQWRRRKQSAHALQRREKVGEST